MRRADAIDHSTPLVIDSPRYAHYYSSCNLRLSRDVRARRNQISLSR
jgi:hypothetical protein